MDVVRCDGVRQRDTARKREKPSEGGGGLFLVAAANGGGGCGGEGAVKLQRGRHG